MLHTFRKRFILMGIIILTAATSVAAGEHDKTYWFNQTADTIISKLAEYDPVWATDRGIHDFDGKLPRYTAASVHAQITELVQFNIHRYLAVVCNCYLKWNRLP